MTDGIKKRFYADMESIVAPVRHICPKTGDYLFDENEENRVSKRMYVRHFFYSIRKPSNRIRDLYEKGANNLTEEELETAYSIIKELKSGRKHG